MSKGNLEKIHDEKISPLITQIAEICMEHGIGMISDFELDLLDDVPIQCSTFIPTENSGVRFFEARKLLLGNDDLDAFKGR